MPEVILRPSILETLALEDERLQRVASRPSLRLFRRLSAAFAVPGQLFAGGQEFAVAAPVAGALVRGAAAADPAFAFDQQIVVADGGDLGGRGVQVDGERERRGA